MKVTNNNAEAFSVIDKDGNFVAVGAGETVPVEVDEDRISYYESKNFSFEIPEPAPAAPAALVAPAAPAAPATPAAPAKASESPAKASEGKPAAPAATK